MKKLIFLTIALFALAFGGCQAVEGTSLFTARYNARTIEAYLATKAKSLPKQVSPRYQPVFIYWTRYGKMKFRGNGTLVKAEDGSTQIITAAHVFPQNIESSYWYETLPDQNIAFNQAIVSIKRQATDDVVIAKTGTQRLVKGVFASSNIRPQMVKIIGETGVTVTSLLDGQKYTLLLVSISTGAAKAMEFAIKKQSYPGESGTGFLDEQSDNLFVLSSGSKPVAGEPALSFVHITAIP